MKLLIVVVVLSAIGGWILLLHPVKCVHGVRLRDHCHFCCDDPCHHNIVGEP